jgi:hypothetical protein
MLSVGNGTAIDTGVTPISARLSPPPYSRFEVDGLFARAPEGGGPFTMVVKVKRLPFTPSNRVIWKPRRGWDGCQGEMHVTAFCNKRPLC